MFLMAEVDYRKIMLLLCAMFVGSAIYSNATRDKEAQPTGLNHPAAHVTPRLVSYSAGAYKAALEQLTDTTTETQFNEALLKLQKEATNQAYAPLDGYLDKAFAPEEGSKKNSWTPAKARTVYGDVIKALEELDSKLLKAGLQPKAEEK
jgi:hypothetical protein